MNNIKVLDCTLRDGGYVNNWNFGKESISNIITQLLSAKIDVIECGFVSQSKETDVNKSIYRDLDEIDEYYNSNVPSDSVMVCMINYGEFDIDDLPEYNGGLIKGIRLAFHKKDLVNALEMCKSIKEKGYLTFVQPMVTQNYSDYELKLLVDTSNEFNPDVLYIVDSFGTMKKQELTYLYNFFDNNLISEISIGFHSHNNMQLSFSNAQILMELDTDRTIYIDSSVYGMGRGAGNLCTELITKYLNDNYLYSYNLLPILEIIDEHLMNIFIKSPWGYSVPFYIASINNCHPNYASYLLDKQTISVKDIHNILIQMDDSKRSVYDRQYIEQLYYNYQANIVDDTDAKNQLKEILKDKKILILAPGKSLKTELIKVKTYFQSNCPLVISVNFIPDIIPADIVFIGNLKRFTNIAQLIEDNNNISKIIKTSNIKTKANKKVLEINYSDYLNEDPIIADNSGIMALNLLQKLGVKDVALAGFDGFSVNRMENYCSESLINSAPSEELIRRSNAISDRLQSLKQVMNIEFITDTMYNIR